MATVELLADTQAGQAPAPLCVLLVGAKEEDFFLIREILERARPTLAAELDHAHSLEEAKILLQHKGYSLVLFAHETGDASTVQLLCQALYGGVCSVPFIVLTENADENTVAEIIAAGAWECVARSQLDGVNLVRTIRDARAALAAAGTTID